MPKYDSTLKGGYIYLAIMQSYPGRWAKDICPIAAVEQCRANGSDRDTEIVFVYYGKTNNMHCNGNGQLQFTPQKPPRAIGRYVITPRSLRSLRKSDWNKGSTRKYVQLDEWITQQHSFFEKCKQKSLH